MGMPRRVALIRREHVEWFMAELLDARSAGTAANRYRSLQQSFRWTATSDDPDSRGGGQIKSSPMVNMHLPKAAKLEDAHET